MKGEKKVRERETYKKKNNCMVFYFSIQLSILIALLENVFALRET